MSKIIDDRPERPAHDPAIDRVAILSVAENNNDAVSKFFERAGAVVIVLLIIAAVIKIVLP